MLGELHQGDNLAAMRGLAPECVDLAYLDPPFNSDAVYAPSGSSKAAFSDRWRWDPQAELAFDASLRLPAQLGTCMRAIAELLGPSSQLAYLAMIAPRLAEIDRVLKGTASLYVHCDPTSSHHLRLLLDALFGTKGFRAEIVWKRNSAHSDGKQGRRQPGRVHDVILFYTKGPRWTWNPQHTPYDPAYVDRFYRHVEPESGRRYRLGDLTGPGGAARGNPRYEFRGVVRHWRYSPARMAELEASGRIIQNRPKAVPAYKRYLDEMPGVPLQDVWADLGPVGSHSAERTGYPTQKPLALLERIIRSSSDPGDLVLDPFCGSGTTLVAAERLGRRWIGIDSSPEAIATARERLETLSSRTAARPRERS